MWGKSMWMDCRGCNMNIRDTTIIKYFSKKLVKKINMVAFGEPEVVFFGSDDKKGYSLIQLIETSNIIAHFSENTTCMYLDVFSCKDFDPFKVIEVVEECFGMQGFFAYKWGIIERGNFD